MTGASIGDAVPGTSQIEAIAERWVSFSMNSWPGAGRPLLSTEKDPFRNPVGSTLRSNLYILAHEVLGEMQEAPVAAALDAVIHLRAVQDLSPSDAVRFVFDLRVAIDEVAGAVPESLHARIDALALLAFSQYTRCREQIFELRVREIRFRAECATR
ncbi:MAG: RsbRD N-terminal domain-containing protein [Acidobacteriota bacterium]